MKFISWNVNGLRACMQKGFLDFFQEIDADIFCLQETKLQEGQIDLNLPGYHQYWNYAEKKGYSGTAIFTKEEPLQVTYGIGVEEHDHEGRVITAEYPEFYFVTVYVPNAQQELKRLDYRIKIAESVDKSIFQYFGKTASLFVRKTGIPTIGLRIFQINLLMCHIQISRIDHRLFLFQFFQISQKIRLPLHPVIQSL